jgi:hypothetical protein
VYMCCSVTQKALQHTMQAPRHELQQDIVE